MYDDVEDHAQSKTDKALISRISKALKSIRKKKWIQDMSGQFTQKDTKKFNI